MARTSHPIFARFYARVGSAMDRGGMARHRQRLLAGLSGRVIEIGAGNGLNFAHYPPQVAHVLAVEPERHLASLARASAREAPVPIDVTSGFSEQLPTRAAAFDAAVASLVLCSVTDVQVALSELRRVIRPGGQLRLLEHVQASTSALRLVQKMVDVTLWPALSGGCHTGRDTTAAIGAAGFTIERLDRFRFPDCRIATPSSPHILAVAIR